VEVGQWVSAGTPAFVVASTASYEVHAWVDETALGRLAIGQTVRLVFRSAPERAFPGQVLHIARQVDRQTHELLVDIAVLEAPANAAIGQRADAWVQVGQHEGVTWVPRGWCDTTCLVAQDGRALTRPVTLGLVGRERVEVVAGVSEGDVVLRPGSLADGRRVRVTEVP
jgi:multidrug efflux pump subunit AcrA (membrane-fusion protein)